jgi:hypothetical protein
MRFNPPPNWPRFPNGWTPPPGWQADPSWPPPPWGWPLWVDEGETLAPWTPPPAARERSPQVPWYRRTLTVVLLLIFFAPAGIVLLWLRQDWSVRLRGVLTGLATVLFIALLASSNSNTPTDTSTTVQAGPAIVGGSGGSTQSVPAGTSSPSAKAAVASPSAATKPSQSPSAAHVSQSTSKAAVAAVVAPPRTTAAPTTHSAKPAPPPTTPPASHAPDTCGAPSNPYGYNFCGNGGYVTSPPSDICSYFSCIDNFWNGRGYMVECRDGTYSMSGGIRGACSYHRGEEQPVYS